MSKNNPVEFEKLSNREQKMAINMFITHEKENFNEDYSEEEAIKALRGYEFLTEYEDGKLVDIIFI